MEAQSVTYGMIYLDLFHQCLGLIYFSAFYSLQVQFLGLYGINGLLPVVDFVRLVRSHFRLRGIELVRQFPSVVAVAPDIGINADAICEVLLILGAISGAFISLGFRSSIIFALLFICYLSLATVGQTFMSFQWDSLLLEVGFLCILSSPVFGTHVHPKKSAVFHWCYRFLAFKLMFSAGVVKLQALCPTWEKLTALEYHFATQCIPNPFAWFAHQLPPILLRFGVAATLVIEIPLAFLLVAPFLYVRRFGAILQVLLQVLILLTGNYNFFNLLTVALMIPVWADDNIATEASSGMPSADVHLSATTQTQSMPIAMKLDDLGPIVAYSKVLASFDKSFVGKMMQVSVCVLFIAVSTAWMIRYDNSPLKGPWWSGDQLSVKTTWSDLQPHMQTACAVGILLCCVHCASAVVDSLYSAVLEYRRKHSSRSTVGFLRKFGDLALLSFRLLSASTYGVLAIIWILLSARMLGGVGDVGPFIPNFINQLSEDVVLSRAVSAYGLFRRMTGVGTFDHNSARSPASANNPTNYIPSVVARPEIVIEGLHPGTMEWMEIPFRYKPADLSTAPPFNVPHQPRLDWQMWFAALGNYQSNPWLVNLIYKLHRVDNQGSSQEGDSAGKGKSKRKKHEFQFPEILALLDEERYPFKAGGPPAAIRAVMYDYDFTRLDSPWARTIPHAEILPNMTISGIISASVRSITSISGSGRGRNASAQTEIDFSESGGKEAMKAMATGIGKENWWYRRNAREYLPPLEKNNPSVEAFLKGNGIPVRPYQTVQDVVDQCLAAGADGGALSKLIVQIKAPLTVASAQDFYGAIVSTVRDAAEKGRLQEDLEQSVLRIMQVTTCNVLYLHSPVRRRGKRRTGTSKSETTTRFTDDNVWSFLQPFDAVMDNLFSTMFEVFVGKIVLTYIFCRFASRLLCFGAKVISSLKRNPRN